MSALTAGRIGLRRLVAAARARGTTGDRGDVPGWVLVTLMTAGLVMGLWAVANTTLTQMFVSAMEQISSL
jgi:hypothetical protein